MSEQAWDNKGYRVVEGPADGQPTEPFCYEFHAQACRQNARVEERRFD